MQEKKQTDSGEPTKLYYGADETTSIRLDTICNAQSRLDICDDAYGTVALVQFEKFREAIIEASTKRKVSVRFVTEIARENLQFCKELMDYVELKHLVGLKGSFVVSERQYHAFAPLKGAKFPTEAIRSDAKTVVEQNQFIFDVLWDKATPAIQRIKELEEGIVPVETRVVNDNEEISKLVSSFIQKAARPKAGVFANTSKERDQQTSGDAFLFVSSDGSPLRNLEIDEALSSKSLKQSNPDFRIKLITDVRKDNLDYVRKQIEHGAEVRHIDRNKIVFVVSKDGYISASPGEKAKKRKEEKKENNTRSNDDQLPNEIIWSNNPDVISQAVQIFDMLWETGLPAEQRIRQLEEGIHELGETRIIKNVEEAAKIAEKLVSETKDEILIVLASRKVVERNADMYNGLVRLARERGFKIRILAPISDSSFGEKLLQGVEWRQIEPMNVGIAIYDKGSMFITQYIQPDPPNENIDPFISNIFTTNKQTISGMVSVFEALWRESELREREIAARQREVKSRRQAQLLQDILTHDIRNYNQVSRLSAELMREEANGNKTIEELADSLLTAIDGSTTLVDRAKSLGRIVSEENPRLKPVSLDECIDYSIELVRQAYPKKQVRIAKYIELEKEESKDTLVLPSGRRARKVSEFGSDAQVLADDLLREVFSNILSNSVKYTDGEKVEIEIMMKEDEVEAEGNKKSLFRITISDSGRGIPEELRSNIFNRYLVGARGSGLGLSIVHALVVDRYKGKVKVLDRGSIEEGTAVEVLLEKARSSY